MVHYKYDDDPINNEKIIKCECACGCGEEIKIHKWIYANDKAEYTVSLAMSQFYAKQQGIIKTIKHRIKVAFNILRGKEYRLTEVELEEKDVKDLMNYLNEMLNGKEIHYGKETH